MLKKENKKKYKDNQDLSSEVLEKKQLHSLFSSANRTKNELYKIARANNWQWFFTFTFSRKKVDDRTDYKALQKKICKWLNHLKERKCPDMIYLLVPEQHKKVESNGLRAWHFHALISNVDALTFEELTHIKYAKKTKDMVYSLKEYKLGYNSATKVKNNDAVTRYISKYITKSLCFNTKNQQRYMVSKSCKRPKEYTYFCVNKYQDNSRFKSLDNVVYLDDIVDLSKVVWKKEKIIDTDEFSNMYTYYELKNDNTPVISRDKIVTKKE